MRNSFYRRTALIIFLYLFISKGVSAQTPDTIIIITQHEADSLMKLLTTAEYDSLMADLDELFSFFDKRENNYLDLSVTAGNGSFTLRNTDGVTYRLSNRFVLSPSVGFFHKSGLGAQWVSYVAPANGSMKLYQHQLSIFYDYLKSKKITAGISYSRIKTKDSAVDFYTTPFKNNLNIYGAWKKSRWRPTLSVNYSNGAYTDVLVRQFFTVYYDVKIREVSVSASVRYSWDKKDWLIKGDYLSFTPRLALMSAGQYLELQNTENRPRLNRLIASGYIPQRAISEFEPQLLALYLSLDYMLGKWYIHPQLYKDYYLHNSDKRSFTTFSLTTGFMF